MKNSEPLLVSVYVCVCKCVCMFVFVCICIHHHTHYTLRHTITYTHTPLLAPHTHTTLHKPHYVPSAGDVTPISPCMRSTIRLQMDSPCVCVYVCVWVCAIIRDALGHTPFTSYFTPPTTHYPIHHTTHYIKLPTLTTTPHYIALPTSSHYPPVQFPSHPGSLRRLFARRGGRATHNAQGSIPGLQCVSESGCACERESECMCVWEREWVSVDILLPSILF
jgi:hypothetical protein